MKKEFLRINHNIFFYTDMNNAGVDNFILENSSSEIKIVRMNCMNMKEIEKFDIEASAALQFPTYYSNNWSSFDECICDLEWLPAEGYLILLVNADLLFSNDTYMNLSTFFKILNNACKEWGREINHGEIWDRKEIPFNVLIQTNNINYFKDRTKDLDVAYEKIDISKSN